MNSGPEFMHDNRTPPGKVRAGVTIHCEARQGTRPWQQARMEDLSPSGFRIVGVSACHPDTPLRVRIPGFQLLSAEIRWQEGNVVGCEFTAPLHVAVFDHLVRCAGNG